MASKSDFNDDEWSTLQRGLAGAGFLVSMSDSGFFDTFKETGALAKHLVDARKTSPSALVRDIANTHGTGFAVTAKPDEVESGTLEALRGSVTLLQSKAPEDLDDYRATVMDVANAVAEAAKGVSGKEAAAVAKIREAVGA